MTFEVPAGCTLPTPARPARVGEFAALFGTALGARRVGDRHLRVVFPAMDGLAETVRDLARRESECCSFFEFEVSAEHERVVLDVRVPVARVDVLDGLASLVGGDAR